LDSARCMSILLEGYHLRSKSPPASGTRTMLGWMLLGRVRRRQRLAGFADNFDNPYPNFGGPAGTLRTVVTGLGRETPHRSFEDRRCGSHRLLPIVGPVALPAR